MTKGFRNKKSALKNARKFKPSSQKWLQRQLDDIYVKKAKAEGHVAILDKALMFIVFCVFISFAYGMSMYMLTKH